VSNGASLRFGSGEGDFDAAVFTYRILVSLSFGVYRDVGRTINVSRSSAQIVHGNWLAIVDELLFQLVLLFHKGTTRCQCSEDLVYSLGGIAQGNKLALGQLGQLSVMR
jgi:hypothetical protein